MVIEANLADSDDLGVFTETLNAFQGRCIRLRSIMRMKSRGSIDKIVLFSEGDCLLTRFEIGARDDNAFDSCIARPLEDIGQIGGIIFKKKVGVGIDEHSINY